MNYKIHFLLLTIVYISFGCNQIYSQVQYGGAPKSFQVSKKLIKDSCINIKGVSIQVPPPACSEDDEIIGKAIKVDFTLDNSGVWLELEDGDRIWQLKLSTTSSSSLSVLYKEFELAEGSELYFYSCDKTEVLGSYTFRNNNKYNIFQTGKISGECVIVELYEPKYVRRKSYFEIFEVGYFFRS
ncbi:MAG: hypothetical protein RLO12_11940 [Fulvivirga sp.]|uniref:hypothetical protein n=1 Tax=Fulvivirga sp. TaxID=1931237 RepID=UPI0033024E8D